MTFNRKLTLAGIFAVSLGVFATSTLAQQRSCHIIQCQKAQVGEICRVTPCQQAGQGMQWYAGHYTEGDGNLGSYSGGSRGQCEARCAGNLRCVLAEYYFGKEGVRCNLYSYTPPVRWNESNDAIIGVWR